MRTYTYYFNEILDMVFGKNTGHGAKTPHPRRKKIIWKNKTVLYVGDCNGQNKKYTNFINNNNKKKNEETTLDL